MLELDMLKRKKSTTIIDLYWTEAPNQVSANQGSNSRFVDETNSEALYIMSNLYWLNCRGLHYRMPFPGNRIFPKKIGEIPGTEHSGISSSGSRFSTGIRDWPFPGLVKGRIFCIFLTFIDRKRKKKLFKHQYLHEVS